MDTFLRPIEKPKNWLMKIAYWLTRRKIGKVISPLKVVYARLPLAFALFSAKISGLDKKLSLSPELALLLRVRVAQINVCSFCIDIARALAMKEKYQPEKFYELENFRKSTLFSEAEKAALAFAEELTVHKKANRESFDALQKHFTERQQCEIAWLIASEHYYNLVNLAFNIHSDQLCDLRLKGREKKNTVVAS